jgi:nitrous oxide reductase
MSRDTGTRENSRRSFLRGLAVMGGVTAVAASTGAETVSRGAETQERPRKPQGYRVTAHVAKYYDKARF